MTDEVGAHLLNTPDPEEWAKTFMAKFGTKRQEIDVELMTGWFTNAMQAMQSSMVDPDLQGEKLVASPGYCFSVEELHELVFMVGGAATGPCLKNAPDLVMPTEEVIEEINRVLAERELPVSVDRAGDEAPDAAEAASAALDAGRGERS